jgi:hypothetical protein
MPKTQEVWRRSFRRIEAVLDAFDDDVGDKVDVEEYEKLLRRVKREVVSRLLELREDEDDSPEGLSARPGDEEEDDGNES